MEGWKREPRSSKVEPSRVVYAGARSLPSQGHIAALHASSFLLRMEISLSEQLNSLVRLMLSVRNRSWLIIDNESKFCYRCSWSPFVQLGALNDHPHDPHDPDRYTLSDEPKTSCHSIPVFTVCCSKFCPTTLGNWAYEAPVNIPVRVNFLLPCLQRLRTVYLGTYKQQKSS